MTPLLESFSVGREDLRFAFDPGAISAARWQGCPQNIVLSAETFGDSSAHGISALFAEG